MIIFYIVMVPFDHSHMDPSIGHIKSLNTEGDFQIFVLSLNMIVD